MAIFLLLATQFRSYVQPVIIMMAIPFGLLAATVLTLLYVPALYLIVDDVVRSVKRRLGMAQSADATGEDLEAS